MSKKLLLCLLPVLIISFVAKTQEDTLSEKILGEVVISASKFVERKKNVVQKIDVITGRNIAQTNAQNTGDLLINTGNVFVQKSQQGGSSPVLRGFEASRVLLVVDGIRMNNAIYRAGHLQNIITIDQNMLERVEILYGPASTLYGSDALGGVIHLRTKNPRLSKENKFLSTGSAFTRYSSVNNEKTIHANLSIGGKKLAWLQAYTYSDFDDMKMGKKYPDKYPDFGRRSQFITSINGIDSVVANDDDRMQKFSGYTQWDITQKLLFKQSPNISHLLNLQFSNSTDVPRYDRLQDIRNGTLRYAEWYYGPQKRIFGSYELSASRVAFLDELKANINFQDIEESRQTREYRRYDRLDSRMEKLKIWGFVVDGRKVVGNHELTLGVDGQINDVKSTATRTNLLNGTISKLDTRYTDGKNKMNYFGLYAQHLLKISGGKWVLNDGIRFQTVHLEANIVDNSFFNFPFTKINQDNFAITGNLGIVFMPSKYTRIASGLSSGFRAPNIDDLTKIFESSTATKRLVVPNPDIKPEYTYNIDLTVGQSINDKVKFEVNGFYSWFQNVIVTAPFRLNDQDSVVYNGVMSAVYASQNRNKAYLYGFNTNVTTDITEHVSFMSTITYTLGRITKFDGSKAPLDHIPPVFGKSSLSYKAPKWNAEIFALYNGWKKIKDYNPDGEDNQQYATPEGMPGWLTVNFRTSFNLNKNWMIQGSVENILDRNYRNFGSGFSAAGRNFIAALRLTF